MTNINEKSLYISNEEKNGITQDILREFFNYKDGFLYCKKRYSRKKRIQIGDKVGYLGSRKRYKITFKNKDYSSARLIFCWHHGYFPETVDHIDRDTLNNLIENLRAATKNENAKNRTSMKGSSSQYLGIHLKHIKEKYVSKITGITSIYTRTVWYATICSDGKTIYLGSYKNEELAALAYNKGAVKYHGEFANLNIIKPTA